MAKASKQWLSIILTSPKLQLIWKENTATRHHTLCLDRAMICPDDLLWGQALFILGLPMQLRQHIYVGTKVKHTSEVLQLFIMCVRIKYWRIYVEFKFRITHDKSIWKNWLHWLHFILVVNGNFLVSDLVSVCSVFGFYLKCLFRDICSTYRSYRSNNYQAMDTVIRTNNKCNFSLILVYY